MNVLGRRKKCDKKVDKLSDFKRFKTQIKKGRV